MKEIKRGIQLLKSEGVKGLTKAVIKYCFGIVSIIFYFVSQFVSYFIPRSNNVWVFVSTDSDGVEFSDNTKYLFLHISNEQPNDKAIWITNSNQIQSKLRKSNYNSCMIYSIRSIYYLLKARHIVTANDIDIKTFGFVGGANIIQLWHGIQLKSVKSSYEGRTLPWEIKNRLLKYDYLVTTSQREANLLLSKMNVENMIISGHSRNDVFFKDIPGSNIGVPDDLLNWINKIEDSERVIGYFPTFRENQPIIDPFDEVALNNFLQRHNSYLLVKPHRYMDIDLEGAETIKITSPKADVYPIFSHIDVMVTDYSSIFYDYLFLDQPVVFYPYDYESYEEERGFSLNYKEHVPGPQAHSFTELLNILEASLEEDTYKQERKKIRENSFAIEKETVSECIYSKIKEER